MGPEKLLPDEPPAVVRGPTLRAMDSPQMRLTQHVDASAAAVWSVLTDLEAADRTLSGVDSVELLTEGPYAVGTRWRETRTMFGRSASEEMEVAEVEENRRTVVVAQNGEVAYRTVFELTEKPGGGTDLAMTFGATLPEQRGLKKVLFRALGRLGLAATRKAMEKDLQDIAAAAARA